MTDKRLTDVLCFLGIHSYRWHYMGTSWVPDAWTRACKRCGQEK